MERNFDFSPPLNCVNPKGALALLIVIALLALPSHALDLKDLNVPTHRVRQPNQSSRWYPPIEPADTTTGWTRYTVTGCDLADNANDDEACVDDTITSASADPGPVIVFFPAGTYNFTTNQTIRVQRSNMILRGEDSATTRLKFHAGQERLCAMNAVTSICFGGGSDGSDVAWTGGFAEDTSVLVVTNTSSFAVGDWVRAHMNKNTGCFDGPQVGNNFDHIAKITSITASTISIDRPLRMDYTADPDCNAGSSTYVRPITMIENVGLENLYVAHTNPGATSYRPGTALERVANGWVTGAHYQSWATNSIRFNGSSRLLVANNYFQDSGSATLNIQQGANDVVIINNIFQDNGNNGYCENGAEGTVYAHNYEVPGYRNRSHSFLMHGEYCRETLIESNDLDSSPSADNYWGRQGPRNTLYRNRLHNNTSGSWKWPHAWYMSTEASNTYTPIADQLAYIANHVNVLQGGPPFSSPPSNNSYGDIDKAPLVTNMYLEFNVASQLINLVTPEPQTDCGLGVGNCAEAPARVWGRNVGGVSVAPAGWTQSIPDSLFLTEAPKWWCEEACPFDQRGIGAFGDDSSGAMCKLPAQIRHEGGTCTPLAPSGEPPVEPPVSPVEVPVLL